MHLYTYFAMMALVSAVVGAAYLVAVLRIRKWRRRAPLRHLRSRQDRLLSYLESRHDLTADQVRQVGADLSNLEEGLGILERLISSGAPVPYVIWFTRLIEQEQDRIEHSMTSAAHPGGGSPPPAA